jgi:hypothetical protein
MENYYGRNESPVEKVCRSMRNLQSEYDSIEKYLEVVKASKEKNPRVYSSVESYQDNCNWVTVSKRYLLTRLRAELARVGKELKIAKAAYAAMEKIAIKTPR